MKYTFGSLCSGIGGLDLGLERAGWTCRWQVENDRYCRSILKARFPHAPLYKDIIHQDWTHLPPVTLLAGGIPCQGFSTMGKQKGMDDERWLWPYMREAVRVLRPSYVLLENVPALRSHAEGRAFGSILADLHALRFDAEWSLVSACSVGAPHSRSRLFLVAYARGERRQQVPRCPYGDEGADEADAQIQDHLPCRDGKRSRRTGHWASEPRLARLADGLPTWMAKAANKATGNAVVPQVAELVARMMLPPTNKVVKK